MKPRALRLAAEADIESAFSYYLNEAGADTALGFLDEIEKALSHIEHNPGTGHDPCRVAKRASSGSGELPAQ